MLIKIKIDMDAANERLKQVFNYLRENKYIRNQQDFTERINSDKSTVSQVLNGRMPISNTMFDKIASTFPQINVTWIKTGSGKMINPTVQQTSYGENSPNVTGDNNHFGGCASLDRAFATLDKSFDQNAEIINTLKAALAEISAQREMASEAISSLKLVINKFITTGAEDK